MTERVSNTQFLIIEPPLPVDATGWEVRVISSHDWSTLVGYVRNWRKISGSISVNDFGSGSIEMNTNNPILSTPFPAGLPGTIRDGEFLWQFWRDGVLRHEWISDDEQENEVGESYDSTITFAGRTTEKVLEWAIHQPVWGERQAYDIKGEPDGGSYRLVSGEDITPEIAWNATPEQVHTALWTSINTIGPDDITVRMSTENPWRYIIQFQGALTGQDVPRIQLFDEHLTKTGGGDPSVDIPEANSDNSWTDLNSTIKGSPAIASVLAFIDRAQSRGVLPFLDVSFNATADSTGAPWMDVTDVTIQAGETLLSLLQRLSDMLGWEFKMFPGFKLWIAQDGYGARKEEEVVFFKSGHQQKHDRKSSSRDVITDVYAQSAQYQVTHQSGTSPVTPWKREAWIEAGGSPSSTSAAAVGQATLEMRKDKRVSRTITVPPELETRKVFIDYNMGDYVTIETTDGMEAVKVVGLTFSSDNDKEFGLEIVIQSAFEAREVRFQRALEKLGSKAATGGAGSSPTGPAPYQRVMGLRDLSDVNLGGLTPGDVLVRDASGVWKRKAPVLSFLTDVDLTNIGDGKALTYDAASQKWKPVQTVVSSVAWTAITGVPSTFPPSAHSHPATDISDSTTVGRSVMKAVDAAAARTAIGAGTSNLALGTTGTTAKAGNYTPAWTEVTGKPSTFEPVVKGIDWLSDVDTATVAPTNGQTLVFDTASGVWKPGTAAAGATNLDALTDVITSGANAPTNGQALVFDSASGQWKPSTVSAGSSATDIYKGGWVSGTSYVKDAVVSYNGAAWMAKKATSAMPTMDTATYSQHFLAGVPTAKWAYSDQTQIAITSDLATGLGGTPPAGETRALQISGSGGTTVTATLTLVFSAPGTFTFSDASTTEGTTWDYGQFQYDGANYGARVGGTAGGSAGQWRTTTVNVASAGTHTFAWQFVHDGSGVAGRDKYLIAGISTTNAAEPQDWQLLGDITPTLDELTDVDTSTAAPTSGQALVWDSTKSLWVPGTVSGGGGSIDALSDVVTSGASAPVDGQGLVWDATASTWKPGVPGNVVQTTFTAGTTSGSASAGTYADAITNLTVRKSFTLTGLQFYAIPSDTYQLMVNGVARASVVVGTAFTVASFTGLSISLPAGTHTIGIKGTVNDKFQYASQASIDYVGTGYDFTAAGWTAIAGAFTPPFIYSGYSNVSTPPVAKLDDLTDVIASGANAPTDGQYLKYDAASGQWKPFTPTAAVTTLDALTDVQTSGAQAPADNQVLVWNAAAAQWQPKNRNVTVSTTAPSSPSVGDVWFDIS